MSSRNRKIVENPATKHYKWKNLTNEHEVIVGGTFAYYDKEKQENVNLELPFSFAILNDDYMRITGFNEKTGKGVWSNEAFKKTQEIVVRVGDEEKMRFPKSDYKLKKGDIEALGGKYTQVVYAAIPTEDGNFEIITLQLSGASLSGAVDRDNMSSDERNHGYTNFMKTLKESQKLGNYITVNSFVMKKKGTTKFSVPTFELGQQLSIEENKQLSKMATELEKFFSYRDTKKEEVPVEAMNSSVAEDEDDMLF